MAKNRLNIHNQLCLCSTGDTFLCVLLYNDFDYTSQNRLNFIFSNLSVLQNTLGFLAKISFTPLLYHPGGCLVCPEKRTSSRNYNLFVWSAVFQPKWNDIQKSYKNYQNPWKSYCFLGYFQSLFNFGWKTAAQTN